MSEFLEAQRKRKNGKTSWYDMITPDLNDERRGALDDALDDKGIFHTTIARVLDQWGYSVSPSQVAHYRQTQLGH